MEFVARFDHEGDDYRIVDVVVFLLYDAIPDVQLDVDELLSCCSSLLFRVLILNVVVADLDDVLSL